MKARVVSLKVASSSGARSLKGSSSSMRGWEALPAATRATRSAKKRAERKRCFMRRSVLCLLLLVVEKEKSDGQGVRINSLSDLFIN